MLVLLKMIFFTGDEDPPNVEDGEMMEAGRSSPALHTPVLDDYQASASGDNSSDSEDPAKRIIPQSSEVQESTDAAAEADEPSNAAEANEPSILPEKVDGNEEKLQSGVEADEQAEKTDISAQQEETPAEGKNDGPDKTTEEPVPDKSQPTEDEGMLAVGKRKQLFMIITAGCVDRSSCPQPNLSVALLV